jgi:[protein-PII] uridylyltransferase
MKLELKAKLLRTFPKARTIQSGRLFTNQLSQLIDSSLVSVFQSLDQDFYLSNHLALIPIGGYGRREIAPYSDIDLLYLHDGKLSEETLTSVISTINNFLYNNEREVGHTCRTIEESFLYIDNLQSYHAILDSRYLIGSYSLFESYKNEFLNNLPQNQVNSFNDWKVQFLEDRIINAYDPLLLSEPNIKIDPLGLRDVQFMYWLEKTSFIKKDEASGVFDFFLKGDTLPILIAYDFLLLTRSALHILCGRKNDRLDLTSQPEIAEFLGFGGKTELPAIERFMSKFYKSQKDIYFYLGMYLDTRKNSPLNIYPKQFSNPDTLYEDVISFFLEAQTNNTEPSRILLNRIRQASNFIDEDFKNNGIIIDSFLILVRNKNRIGHLLTLMHECNILGKLIPEFGACTNFPLFSYHHQYTVDEHTLLILRELDKLISGTWEDTQIQEIFNHCVKVDILILAILIHDAGKVKEGDHCQYGAELALTISERFRLSDEDTELLRFLVAEHIIMSELSSKRDIYDPNLILSFAKMFSEPNTLRLLYIMTIIDTKSVGKGILTNWKKEILFFLYSSTLNILQQNTNPIQSIERIGQTLETYLLEKEGLEPNICQNIVQFALNVTPQSYLNFNTPRRIFQHYINILDWKSSNSHIKFISESEPAFITISIFSPENRKLSLFVSGTISALGLSLVGMRLFRTQNGDLILQAQITDQFGSGAIGTDQIVNIENKVSACIDGSVNIEEMATTSSVWSSPTKIPDGMVEELVRFSNDLSFFYTVLEIRVPDSLGLVYRILKTLLDFNLNVIFVRISTSADFAYDSFHIQTNDGQKVEDSDLIFSIKEKILEVTQMKQNQGIFEINF